MIVKKFSYPAQMHKSGEEKDGRIPIKIIPSAPTFDRQNDKILLRAFDKECSDQFIYDGVLDYDHKSVLGKTDLEKAQALIGQPEKLYIDEKKGVPVCEGFLIKGNPFVDNVIAPILNSGASILGASVGGKILKKSTQTDPKTKLKKNVISKISLKHIAITPLQKAVNQNTSVSLKKSFDGDDFELSFNDFDHFLKSFEDPEDISKALEAGAVTNIANLEGGQALQKQSLEGDNKKKKKKINKLKIKSAFPFILDNIVNGLIKGGAEDYKKYFIDRGFTADEAEETNRLIASRSKQIVKLIF